MNQELIDTINRIRTAPIKELGGLNSAYVRVSVLLDYIQVINSNSDQLITPACKGYIKTGQEAASQLYDYVILEICSFYDIIKQRKKTTDLDLPDLPDYLPKIYTYRNSIPGHLDRDKRLKTGDDWIKVSQGIFSNPGIETILIDFYNSYQDCIKRFGDDII